MGNFLFCPNSFVCSRPRRGREHQEKFWTQEHKTELEVYFWAARLLQGRAAWFSGAACHLGSPFPHSISRARRPE